MKDAQIERTRMSLEPEMDFHKVIEEAAELNLAELAIWFREFASNERRGTLDGFRKLAGVFFDHDAHHLAHEAACAGLRQFPGDAELRLSQALALAECGAVYGAHEIAYDLYQQLAGKSVDPRLEEETLGLVARIHRDLAFAAVDVEARTEQLQKALEFYERAYQKKAGFWVGINTAAIWVLRRDFPRAKKIALAVYRQLFKEVKKIDRHEERWFWVRVALGEAALILGKTQKAVAWYRQARGASKKKIGQLAAARRQARFLLDHQETLVPANETDRARIDACFDIPHVVVFAGHMVDQAGRHPARFPRELAGSVFEKIFLQLKQWGRIIGYSSAACGSDIIFLEAVQELGGDSYVVLPYDPEEFVRDSVEFAGEEWLTRFKRVLSRAVEVITVSPHQKLGWGSVSYDYANQVLLGLARAHAHQLDSDVTPLALWDGLKGDGPGGTASVVERWQSRLKTQVEIIDPRRLLEEARHPGSARAPAMPPLIPQFRRPAAAGATEIRAMMFADVEHFSSLSEEQMPSFVEHFLYKVCAMAAISSDRPRVQESRGDGVYFVFDGVAPAGRFALELSERLKKTAWEQFGLPAGFRVRIGLHAGPVYHFTCPFTKVQSYTGHHVNQAARIEPITPPGEVYASREFAALASEAGVQEFACEYAGLAVLHKNYANVPIYHLRRK